MAAGDPRGWEGCKIHVTETCDDAVTGRPHLVTNVASTDATGIGVAFAENRIRAGHAARWCT